MSESKEQEQEQEQKQEQEQEQEKGKGKMSVNEAMNEYYKLKSKYESDYYDKYIKGILKDNQKSKREKRLEYQKLPKAECINCRRNVGSIFTIKKDPEEYSRTFIASCGDLTNPCPLDINFEYTFRNELNKELMAADEDINNIKNKIIIDKNNMMFGYINQAKAIASFNNDASELKTITEGAGFIMEINIQLNDNPIKHDLTKKNEEKFGIEYLLPFKDMIKTFEQTGDAEIVNKAVKLYIDEMAPLSKTIRNLKYEVNYIDFLEKKDNEDSTEKGDLYILVQKKNSIQTLEFNLFGNDELNSFTKGIEGFDDTSATKTKTNLEQVHKKTRKLRPSIEFVEEESADADADAVDGGPINLRKKLVLENATEALSVQSVAAAEDRQEQYNSVQGDIIPQKGPGGIVAWTNNSGQRNIKYQQIWDALSPEYKAALSEDEAWMKKTIDHFVEFANLKKENKVPYTSSREFVHPDGLLLPPRKISDTEFDYGNAVYNKLLNGGGPGIWMTFLPKSDKNSTSINPITQADKANKIWGNLFPEYYSNEYNPYLNAIASNLEYRLRFTKF
jgi:hypothetical protein